MKKIIVLFCLIGLFSCEKESYIPELVTIEFRAAFAGGDIDNNFQLITDTVSLSVENLNTGQVIKSKHTLYKNKPGVINLLQFPLEQEDDLNLIISSEKSDYVYLYLNVYKNRNHKIKVDFEDYKEISITNSKKFYRLVDVR